jgi:2-keto-3-deoxy-6-phosphogluconate aldolase
VELDNPHEFLNNGAASVGLVGPLFDAKDISEGNWDSITAKV